MISIHAPRVGGDAYKQCMFYMAEISIHAPRVGGDKHGTTKGGKWL